MSNRSSMAERTLSSVEFPNPAPGRTFESGDDTARPSQRAIALLNPACVVCGQENPHGLHLEFQSEQDPAIARAPWTASVGWESFQGVIHGGVISAVLDEAMSKAIIFAGHEAFTAEMKIRFRRKVSIGETLSVRGWVVAVHKRKISAEASLASADGVEKAHAWATFLTARPA